MKRRVEHGVLKVDSKRTPEGYLCCEAVVAKAGNVQTYYLPGGQVRREYRPADEVFKADSLATISHAPITYIPNSMNMHPPEGMINSKVARKYTVGWTGHEAKGDGNFVKTTAKIIDEDAISAAEKGEASELSCGYSCDLDFTAGATPQGEHYDAIQRNIRVNHISMVRSGRAGSDVRLRLDSNDDAVQDTLPAHEGSRDMKKIKINGVEVEVDDLVVQLLDQERKMHQDAIDGLKKVHTDSSSVIAKQLEDTKKELEQVKARADSAEEAKKVAEKARADAEDPKRIDSIVHQRVELFSKVRSVLGSDAKLDGKDVITLKKECLAKMAPDLKLDGKTDPYVEAAFDYTFGEFAKKNPSSIVLAEILAPPAPGDHADAEDARTNYMKEQAEKARKMGREVPKA